MQYTEKLDRIERHYEDLTRQMADPEVIGDTDRYRKVTRQQSELSEIVSKYREWKKVDGDLEGARQMLDESDPDIREMAREDVERLEPQIAAIEDELKVLLLPKDPNDEKNVILEIRKGTGGDEASLFAGDLFRMYLRYAEERNWKVEVISSSESEVGGLNEVIAMISGAKVYSQLKYESGVHRVQRVPATEAQGRIHTSTATVAVLPEAEEVDIEIKPEELDISVCRASGPGGQGVNTTDSAVQIIHKPSGLIVRCADQRSQQKNKARALTVLRSRLLEQKVAEENAKYAAQRKAQVGTGERSEKIRTYNFPQNRVTDHRIELTLYNLMNFIEGAMDPMIDPLMSNELEQKLAALKN